MFHLTRRFVLSFVPKLAVVAALRKFFSERLEELKKTAEREVFDIRFLVPKANEDGAIDFYFEARRAIVEDGIPKFDTINLPDTINGQQILYSRRQRMKSEGVLAAIGDAHRVIVRYVHCPELTISKTNPLSFQTPAESRMPASAWRRVCDLSSCCQIQVRHGKTMLIDVYNINSQPIQLT